ncbi:T9SS type A sorting domain-containing protein [Soonwooa sp.]|uniref:T9SS type A sorting domain-containing protein n=1 Tax=Soonwooa sp. TaxID=1938592 RepID=UPI00261BDB1A|nr:T9SS type A sorting domain-containing protein [Soonwooa sp.]
MKKTLLTLIATISLSGITNAQTSCDNTVPSKNQEDAYGNITSTILANDFTIAGNTTKKISKITVNTAETSALTSLSFFIYDNSTTNFPKTQLSKVTLTPTSSTLNANKFGLAFKTYTFQLATPIVVSNTSTSTQTYWLGIGESNGTEYLETTSTVVGYPSRAYNANADAWMNVGSDIVFSFTATCDAYLATSDLQQSKISLYPNPAQKEINITGAKTINNVEIYNLAGGLVKKTNASANKSSIDISVLPKGNYILKAEVDGANKTFKFTKD